MRSSPSRCLMAQKDQGKFLKQEVRLMILGQPRHFADWNCLIGNRAVVQVCKQIETGAG